MSHRSTFSLRDVFHEAPGATFVVAGCPIMLALAQLGLVVRTDLPVWAGFGFAVAMVVFAVVATGHLVAETRLQRLEEDYR